MILDDRWWREFWESPDNLYLKVMGQVMDTNARKSKIERARSRELNETLKKDLEKNPLFKQS